ncbi:MAG: dethiobiotin synthase [Bacteroidales bacterium]|nr:dethiobiotin synthase [Bacteroidales bacterium]
MKSIFISGIDTDAGKTYCTAWLAMRLQQQGHRVVTMKFIQTGNVGHSEDIDAHRRIMGTGPLPEDAEGLTAPVIFSYPASAQLAARIDGREIDLSVIDRAREELERRYDIVLVEGAGGLMVPITDDFFSIDYAATRGLPMALVTNGVLGSINHTILSLEAIKARGIELRAVLYNQYFDSDATIAADTQGFITRYCAHHFPDCEVLMVPSI